MSDGGTDVALIIADEMLDDAVEILAAGHRLQAWPPLSARKRSRSSRCTSTSARRVLSPRLR